MYGYDDRRRRENARQGWFSFQDYACSYWHCHIETFIRQCHSLYNAEPQIEFSNALQLFVQTHGQYLTRAYHQELEWDCVEKFQCHQFYDDLLLIWNHIFSHQKGSFETRNKVGILQIDDTLRHNRTVLEDNFVPSYRSMHEDTIEDYYGPNLFKCRRTLCRFFHVGYNNKKARDNHDNRHDRPYLCPVECKLAPIGFTTMKDRERHIRIYHPELSERPSVFEAPSQGHGSTRFTCPLCKKTLTRKENLKSHERSHFGTRPYPCSKCGKAFGRVSDCRRHEKNKSCKI